MRKTAINYDKIPHPDQLAVYVESLKLYLDQNQIDDPTFSHIIKNMPSPKAVRSRFSEEEGKVLFQSIQYVWKEITGQDIIEEEQIIQHPEKLEGNYWMLNNGVLLSGPNHFTIIRDNTHLFCTLLDINPFSMHEQLASKPNNIIKTILDHGGMRIFVNKNRIAYFQLTSDTYRKWGISKIRGLDIEEKNVKVIDKSRAYKGWDSGITVRL